MIDSIKDFKNMNVEQFKQGVKKFVSSHMLSKNAFRRFKKYDIVPGDLVKICEELEIVPLNTHLKNRTCEELLEIIKSKVS